MYITAFHYLESALTINDISNNKYSESWFDDKYSESQISSYPILF